jgi:long-chain acyl-CoA synthetase
MSLGLSGKRIALISETRYEWVTSYLSTVNGVGVTVPLDKELPADEIRSLFTRSESTAVIFSNGTKEKVLAAAQGVESLKMLINMDDEEPDSQILSFSTLMKKGHELVGAGDRSFLDAEIDVEAMSMLLFTSGTTEQSKAVMLSHHNVAANLMAMCSMLYIGPDDVFLSILPIHHTYECTCGFLCQMYRGTTVAFCEGLRHIQKNLKECHATVMLGVPLIFEAMYKRIWDQVAKNPDTLKKLKFAIKLNNFLKVFKVDLSKKLFAALHDNFGGKLRLFISGAAGIDPTIAKGYRDLGINLVQGYGLTECAPIAALNRDVDFKDDAAGLPLPGLSMEIVDKNSDGIGEVRVKGPNVMLGYYENEEATKEVLKDGWFYTGDLGFMDEDGFVHLTGRKKNVIVTKNGKNIFPEEIETMLNRSPYVLESMVVGKESKDAGELTVHAVIVPNQENVAAELGENAPEEKVQSLFDKVVKEVNHQLILYKYIKSFTLRENEFAKTTTKKVKRYMEHV